MKLHPMTVKKSILKTGLSGVFCLSLSSAMAAPVNITNNPLFIADSVAPGIFIMMDDSGSMDWEVLTSSYYAYDDYYEDSSSLQTHGLFNGYTTEGGWRTFYYMYDNSDDLYSYFGKISENINAYERDWRIKSSEFNVMFYDPSQTYSPWQAKNDDTSNASAVIFPNADFAAVRSNPQPTESGYSSTKNLDGFIWEVAANDSFGYCGTSPDGPEDDYDHNRCALDADCNVGVSCTIPQVDLWDSHTRYKIVGSTIKVDLITYTLPTVDNDNCPDSDDPPSETTLNTCFGRNVEALTDITDAVLVANIKQNVANWYQYNRKRSMVAKSAVAAVIERAPFYRFGIGTLQDMFFTPLPADNITDYIPHNQNLFNQFAEWDWVGNRTYLRGGLNSAGKYFQGLRTGYTGSDKPIVHQCQQNFTILFTDGFYNGSSVSGIGDEDGDGTTSSLADIAHYYYETDLDAYADVVPTTDIDTQNQQHMVTFAVAFGVTGDLVDTDGDGLPNPLPNHVSPKWYSGSAIDTDPERIDDMWHASYDSKGSFISAKTPADVVQGINKALSAIENKVGSASSAAASTGASVLTDTNVFFAFFDSNDWSGDLLAYDIVTNSDTQVSTFNNSISASTNFYANARSKFYSWDPAANSAIDFDWASLNSVQQGYLNDNPDTVAIEVPGSFGAERLAFIRGDTSKDGLDIDPGANVVEFRDRAGKTFGDILNSSPQFVGGTADANGNPLAFINSDFTEGSSFAAFQTANRNRDHMIYVGANDGLLHGLIVDSNPATTLATIANDTDAITSLSYLENYGKEAFAYIPSAVIKRLNKLTSSEYEVNGIATHRYLVDGSPTIEDAYIGSWKTVLVSGLGGGGQGVFALDVTDGATTASNNIVLWEFNDSDDAELGYTYSRPVVARLHDGNWYAIFGNGYNNSETNDMDGIPDSSVSTTGHAVLFVLKMSGPTGLNNSWVLGTDYYKLDTGVGSITTPNALATVSTLDMDRDQVVDAVYAGDILGNLWRFDLLDGDTNINSGGFPTAVVNGATQPTAEFRVAYGTLDTPPVPVPVFTTDAGQPITSAPVIATHPIDGFMVIFGTGQYVESGDNQTTGLPTQSLYGIWDDCVLSHEVGNDAQYQLFYKGTYIPSSAASCEKALKSSLLQQSIVKEEIETFTQAVDSNGDGVIDTNDTPTDRNTEEVRITTGYKLSEYDKSSTPVNTQSTISGTDQFGNTISSFTYTSETGWLNNTNTDPALPPAITAVSHRGWYLDMIFNGNNKSERNVNKPLLLSGTVFFNTYTPSSSSSCGAAGDTWIYSLNASDGRQLAISAFDLNQDDRIDQQDKFNQAEVIGARKRTGFTPGGTIINASGKKHSITYGGHIDDMHFKIYEGRQNWRVIK